MSNWSDGFSVCSCTLHLGNKSLRVKNPIIAKSVLSECLDGDTLNIKNLGKFAIERRPSYYYNYDMSKLWDQYLYDMHVYCREVVGDGQTGRR